MDGKNENILKAIDLLVEVKKNTTDETLRSATEEELIKYIDLLEEIKGKINYLTKK